MTNPASSAVNSSSWRHFAARCRVRRTGCARPRLGGARWGGVVGTPSHRRVDAPRWSARARGKASGSGSWRSP